MSFLQQMDTSFLLYLENQLLQAGFYSNYSGELFAIKNNRASPKSTWASNQGGFVYDSSISGASVPPQIVSNGVPLLSGQSGLSVDYLNGRISSSMSGTSPISGQFSFRKMPVYIVPEVSKDLVFQTRWRGKLGEWEVPEKGLAMNERVAPCVFLTFTHSVNEPFQLGGMDETIRTARAVILTDNGSDLTTVEEIFTDMARRNFMVINQPFGFGNDFRNGVFNYSSMVEETFSYSRMVNIQESYFNRFGAAAEANFNRNAVLGFAEVVMSIPRMTREQRIYDNPFLTIEDPFLSLG